LTSGLEATREFFDSYWRHPAVRRLDSIGLFAKSATLKAYSLIGTIEGKRVLEVGPGEGCDLKHFSRSGASLTAVDLSRASLELCRKSCPESSLAGMDGASLAFREATFDIIFSRTVLMHVDKRPYLEECRRVLRPGGKAVFVEPLKYSPFLLAYRGALSSGRMIEPDYLKPSDILEMEDIFGSTCVWYFYLLSALGGPFVSIAPWSRPIFIPLEVIDRGLLRAVPLLRNLTWISVIECTR
jgi:SAM-dependent methyltransferase